MYSSYNSPWKKAGQSAAKYLKDLFKGAGPQTPGQAYTNPVNVPGITSSPVSPSLTGAGGYQPYQIKTGDTFEKIAAANNASVSQIQAANGGMVVPPPKGSYVNLPAPAPLGYTGPSSLSAPYGPPAASVASYGIPGTYQSMTGLMHLDELSAQTQKLVAQGQLPQSVSVYAPIINPNTGQPVTAEEMTANGYTYDSTSQQWNLNASAQTTTTTTANDNPRTVYYSRARGYVTPEVARLLNKKKRRRQQDNKQKPGGGPVFGEGPKTTLNVHLGGG